MYVAAEGAGPSPAPPGGKTDAPPKADPKEKADPKGKQAQPKGDDKTKAAEPKAKDDPPKAGDKPKTVEPKAKDTPPKAAEPKAKDTPPKAAEPKAKDGTTPSPQPKTGEKAPKADPKATEKAPDGGKATITTQQRTEIRQTIIKSGNAPRVTNVNFTVSVGAVVPRTVTVVVLPPRVVEIYPAWRGYRYFLIGDRIIIIDDDFRIVFIIDA